MNLTSSKVATLAVLIFVVILCSSAHGLKSKTSGQKKSRSEEKTGTDLKDNLETKTSSINVNSTDAPLISLLHLDKWIAPRYIDQLTNTFNTLGVPASVMVGIGLVVLLPIYLGTIFLGWLPLHKLLNPVIDEPDYSGYYKAPASSSYYGEPSKPQPMYGYPAPSPSPQYGYGYADAPAPKPHYGYSEAPAPKALYGYNESPAPTMSYGYPSGPAPTPSTMYGGYSAPSAPAPSQNYGYSNNNPADPTPSASYGYSAIVPSPAPSSQYGEPAKPSPSYGVIDSDSKILKSDVQVTARKARSIRRLNDDQCVERLACELSKATQEVQLPTWVKSMADMLPLKGNSLVNEARKFLSLNNCSSLRCDSFDIWGKY